MGSYAGSYVTSLRHTERRKISLQVALGQRNQVPSLAILSTGTPSQGTNSVFSKSATNFGLLGKSILEDLGDVTIAMPPEMMCACMEGKPVLNAKT